MWSRMEIMDTVLSVATYTKRTTSSCQPGQAWRDTLSIQGIKETLRAGDGTLPLRRDGRVMRAIVVTSAEVAGAGSKAHISLDDLQ